MGRKRRIRIGIKNWWTGYIDFSGYKVENYQYVKSTYKDDIASSLITNENICFIKNLIPEYKEYEKRLFRLRRIVFERRGEEKGFDDSFLFRIYSNGFTSGFKKIDKTIKKEMVGRSVGEIRRYIKLYHSKLDHINDYHAVKDKRKFDYVDFLVDIGLREGSFIRGELYAQEMQTKENLENDKQHKQSGRRKRDNKLSILLSDAVLQKDLTISYISDYIKNNTTGIDLAYLRIALQELDFTKKLEHEEYYRALCSEFGENEIQIGSDTIRSAYNSLVEKNEEYSIVKKDIKYHRDEIDDIKFDLTKINSINSDK